MTPAHCHRLPAATALLVLSAACSGCPPRPAPADAGGATSDAAHSGHPDGGGVDAAPPPDAGAADAATYDAGTDAGHPVDAAQPDASATDGAPWDAAAEQDAGPADAGGAPDAAAPADGGGPVDAGGLDAGTADAATPDAAPAADGGATQVPLRLMAANLTSGNFSNYDPGHGIRLVQGVHPDVVLIQEFNYGDNSDAAMQALADTMLGTGAVFCREPGGDQIPNGILSRWPITWCGQWDDGFASNRDFAVARVDLPGPADLWAVSVHLLTSSVSVRNQEAALLVQYVADLVPTGDFLVIAGDLNTDVRTELALQTLAQAVITDGPYPADQDGNTFTNTSRSRPYDWVLVNPALHARGAPTVVGQNAFPAGLVLDSRVYTPLQDVAPVELDDSRATNMQHMGVVRDFLLTAP